MSKELESIENSTTGVRKPAGVQRIQSTADKIHEIHERIAHGMRDTVEDFMKIGELLAKEKKKLPHGEFQKWFIESEFPFAYRTARAYMNLYKKREQVSRALDRNPNLGLKDVIRLLSEADTGEGGKEDASPAGLFLRMQSAGLKSLTKPEREQVKGYLKATLERIDERRKELKGYYDRL